VIDWAALKNNDDADPQQLQYPHSEAEWSEPVREIERRRKHLARFGDWQVHLFDEIGELFGGVVSARRCGGAAPPWRSQGRHETSGGAHRGLVGQLTPRVKFTVHI
jgi:hypothetical protein